MTGGGATSPITEWSEPQAPELNDWPENGWTVYQDDASYEKRFTALSNRLVYIRMNARMDDVGNQRATEKKVNLTVRDHEMRAVTESAGGHYGFYGYEVVMEVSLPHAESCIPARIVDVIEASGYMTSSWFTRDEEQSGGLTRE